MTKTLALYYSTYGHMEKFIRAGAESILGVDGVDVTIKRVGGILDDDQGNPDVPVVSVDELPDYDGFMLGFATRFGMMAGPMRHFWDQTGVHWGGGALIGKTVTCITGTKTGGGAENALISAYTSLMHQGLICIGLPYSCPQLSDVSEVRGGSPYGAAYITGDDGPDQRPSAMEREMVRFQGRHFATITKKLAG